MNELREAFENILIGCYAPESPRDRPSNNADLNEKIREERIEKRQTARRMADQLVAEVERHIASIVVPESLAEKPSRELIQELIDAANEVVANWEEGDLAGSVNVLRVVAGECELEMGKPVSSEPAEPIIVEVSGGLVQDVRQVPAGVTVEVRDYEVAKKRPRKKQPIMEKDAQGHWYSWEVYGCSS
jgi:hypothetical protein